jgi:transcriptional regulator with XRE-family HTH domain
MRITVSQIRQARALLRMSQEQLARAAGIARPTLSEIENGKTVPHESTTAAIRAALERRGIVFMDGERPTCYFDETRAEIIAR